MYVYICIICSKAISRLDGGVMEISVYKHCSAVLIATTAMIITVNSVVSGGSRGRLGGELSSRLIGSCRYCKKTNRDL